MKLAAAHRPKETTIYSQKQSVNFSAEVISNQLPLAGRTITLLGHVGTNAHR